VKILRVIVLVGITLSGHHAAAEVGTGASSGAAPQPAPNPARSAVKVFKYTNSAGITSFSDRAPENRGYRVIEISLTCYACNLSSQVDWHNTPLHLSAYSDAITAASRHYRVDPALVRAMIHAESAFKPAAKSRAGALGLMQLMPDTARDMGVADPLSPADNIHGGVRYLAWLLKKTRGNTLLATAAYNAGPGAVERHDGIPPYEETETYVKRVRILHGRYKQALNRPAISGRHVTQASRY
jgi:soluble lytic murein transglycosylase-like protein